MLFTLQRLFNYVLISSLVFIPTVASAYSGFSEDNFDVTFSNLVTSGTSDLEVGYTYESDHTFENGQKWYFTGKKYVDGLPPGKDGFDFSGVSLGTTNNFAATVTPIDEGSVLEIVLTATPNSGAALFTMQDVILPSEENCYQMVLSDEAPGDGVVYYGSKNFPIGVDCSNGDGDDLGDTKNGIEGTVTKVSRVVMGNAVGVSWDAYEGASSYIVGYSTDFNAFQNQSYSAVSGITDTQYLLTGLDTSTQYYVMVLAMDGTNTFLAVSEFTEAASEITTGKKTVGKTRIVRPKPLAKKKKKKRFNAKIAVIIDGADFVKRYKVQIRRGNGKKIKTVKMAAGKRKKIVRGLKPGRTYKFRIQAVLNDDGGNKRTRWSKYTKFKTKGSK